MEQHSVAAFSGMGGVWFGDGRLCARCPLDRIAAALVYT